MADACTNGEVEANNPEDECKKEQMINKTPEDVGEPPRVEQMKDEVEESDDKEVETDDGEVESEDDCVMETTPQDDASVVKYSVKTTPYLQRWVQKCKKTKEKLISL